MSTLNTQIRLHSLFPTGDSYIDTPEMSQFLHITRNGAEFTLHCLVNPDQPIVWRRIVSVPAVDRIKTKHFQGVPHSFLAAVTSANEQTTLFFLDPRQYDANNKEVENL